MPARWSRVNWSHPNWPRLRGNLRHDLPASLVVFLVAVPLSLGIATASGAPLLAGLIAAAVGGVVAGLLGGSALQVSGPAAGLTVVVAELIGQFGWATTCAITVLAGLLQLALGASRIGHAALAISPTVVHAMLAGIGATIVLGQTHVLLGGSAGPDAIDNLRALPGQLLGLRPAATVVGLLVVAVLLVWPRLPAGMRRVPGPLVAVVLATLFAAGLSLDVARVDLPGSPLAAITLPTLPHGQWGAFALGVFTVTVIASVESLLSAVAVDKLHSGPRSDLNRELIGQGAANTVSGLLGGLPVTGVIMRSSANVAAGARSRLSTVLHGAWVLVFALLLVDVIELIPLAALAGLLVITGAQLIRVVDIRRAHTHGELLVYLATVLGVVLVNLLAGVLIGLAVALLGTLRRVVKAGVRVTEPTDTDRWTVLIEGQLSFLAVPRLARALNRIPADAPVDVQLAVDYLDPAAEEHLSSWMRRHGPGATRADQEQSDLISTRRVPPGPPTPATTSPTTEGDHLHPLMAGVHDYHQRGLPALRPQLAKLAGGQQPTGLFLTCADSRIVPNVITSSGPGELFTVRNIGNLVPPPGVSTDSSVAASVAYAVSRLRVPNLLVCGHSGCGAMEALLSTADGQPGGDPIAQWLRWGRPSLRAWRSGHPLGRSDRAEVDQLGMVNVAVQLATLHQLPVVAAAVAAGELRLTGLFFDIATGQLHMLDADAQEFAPMPGVAAH